MKESAFPIGKEKEMSVLLVDHSSWNSEKDSWCCWCITDCTLPYIIRISFGLDQSYVYRDISILEPLIKLCIPLPKKLYKRSRRLRTIEEVEQYFPDFKAFIDATEQEIPRPKNKRKEKEELLLWQKEERNILLSRHNILR